MARSILIVFLNLFFSGGFSQTGKLIVIVKGAQTQKGGELSTGIFIKENFPKVGQQLLRNETAVTKTDTQIIFEKVPVGIYGVVSFQDIDKDKNLNSNFFGYPTEPIGFSRDAKIKFGPPDFDDAKITIESNKTLTIIIILK